MKRGQMVYDVRTNIQGTLVDRDPESMIIQVGSNLVRVPRLYVRAVNQGGRTINPEDVRLCNCHKCGKELLGKSNPSYDRLPPLYRHIPIVAARPNGRPVCGDCLIKT